MRRTSVSIQKLYEREEEFNKLGLCEEDNLDVIEKEISKDFDF